MNKLRELQQRHNGLVQELRTMQEGGQNPEPARVDAIEAELRSLQSQIKAEETILKQHGVSPYTRIGESAPAASEETRAALLSYMRSGVPDDNLRSLTSGTTGGSDTGGYLIPEEWEKQIVQKETDNFVMRQLADVQTSETDRNIPVADELGESAWIAEGGEYPESDPVFSKKKMEAHKVGRICKVSEELLMDNQYSLENWLTATFAETNGLAMEKAYFRGDGANKPRGFLLDADVVDATGAGAVLSYNHLLELFAALKENYYLNATWLLNRKTLIKIMALKDDAGGYIYRPFETRTETAPLGSILGRPVAISELMEDVAPGKKPVAFGDFRRYRIHDRVGFTIQRLNEKYADTGFIGFRGMQRTDGKLLIPEAIKVLQFAGE